ncbi:hypothetical protein [Tsukamurella sp. 1534]|uniref:hypothetical protein n=1 Tax=Tsukamurella sp. 1534 TaxID=1151061 RepID=UPI0003099190|nr:hypothetical protein [Tsukamurella sp. 1534]
MTVLAIGVGGAVSAVLGYRLVAAPGDPWLRVLVATLAVSVALGAVARMTRIAADPGFAVYPVAVFGAVVSFVGIGWMLHCTPRRQWWRAAVILGGAAAAALLGYIAIDVLGLAYLKFPRLT